MADIKQVMVSEIATQLARLGVPATYGNGADVIIDATFVDASWSTGKKQIKFEASVLLDETCSTAFMWQKTGEFSQGFSFGFSGNTYVQKGKTLFRKVKAVQYGPDGKAYEYELDLGAITAAVEQVAKRYGWKFSTVLSRDHASYRNNINAPFAASTPAAFCSGCGKPVSGRFCQGCGQPVNDVVKPTAVPPPTYGQQPAYINTPQPAVRTSIDKEALLFWGAWGILAILSVIMLVDGITFLRFAGFALLLLFPLLTKRKLFEKLVPSLVTWAGVFVAFILVVSLFPPASDNGGTDAAITTGKTVRCRGRKRCHRLAALSPWTSTVTRLTV